MSAQIIATATAGIAVAFIVACVVVIFTGVVSDLVITARVYRISKNISSNWLQGAADGRIQCFAPMSEGGGALTVCSSGKLMTISDGKIASLPPMSVACTAACAGPPGFVVVIVGEHELQLRSDQGVVSSLALPSATTRVAYHSGRIATLDSSGHTLSFFNVSPAAITLLETVRVEGAPVEQFALAGRFLHVVTESSRLTRYMLGKQMSSFSLRTTSTVNALVDCGAHVIAGTRSGELIFATQPNMVVRRAHTGAIEALDVIGAMVIAGGSDGRVTLWSTTGEYLQTLCERSRPGGGITSVALISGATGQQRALWGTTVRRIGSSVLDEEWFVNRKYPSLFGVAWRKVLSLRKHRNKSLATTTADEGVEMSTSLLPTSGAHDDAPQNDQRHELALLSRDVGLEHADWSALSGGDGVHRSVMTTLAREAASREGK